MQTSGLFHVNDFNVMRKSQPSMSFSQTNQGFKLPWVRSNLASLGTNLPHVDIRLGEQSTGLISDFGVESLFSIRQVIPKDFHVQEFILVSVISFVVERY